MASSRALLSLLCILCTSEFVIAGAGAETKNAPALATVGMTTRAFTDPSRKNWQNTGPRPLNTVIWYPAAAGSPTAPFVGAPEDAKFFGPQSLGKDFSPVAVAYDAPLEGAGQKHPLILLSHGSTNLGLSLMWLGVFLAQHGYIVAAVNHHGNTAAEVQMVAQAFLLSTERAEDVSAVLTKMLGDAEFGGRIDRDRIAAAGHSAGGTTVIELAGGVYEPGAIMAYCNSAESKGDATCEPRELIKQLVAHVEVLRKTDPVVQEAFGRLTESHRDPRIKAVFAMAPAIGPGFTAEGLRPIQIPVEIVVGDADDVAPAQSNAMHFAKLIPGAKLTVLPLVGHMTFGGVCTAVGKKELDGCRDVAGVDRASVLAQVEREALAFFEGAWGDKK